MENGECDITQGTQRVSDGSQVARKIKCILLSLSCKQEKLHRVIFQAQQLLWRRTGMHSSLRMASTPSSEPPRNVHEGLWTYVVIRIWVKSSLWWAAARQKGKVSKRRQSFMCDFRTACQNKAVLLLKITLRGSP